MQALLLHQSSWWTLSANCPLHTSLLAPQQLFGVGGRLATAATLVVAALQLLHHQVSRAFFVLQEQTQVM